MQLVFVAGVYSPATHTVHCDFPPVVYDPAEHAEHTVWFMLLVNDPAGHAWHIADVDGE